MTSITPSPEMGLLPCPFCGGEASVVEIEPHSHSGGIAEFMPDHPGSAYIDCVCGVGIIDASKDDAIKRWNTRATPALSCPDGFRLVPVEPTPEMVRHGEDALRKSGSNLSDLEGRKAADKCYRAMLAASPAPAVGDNAGWRPLPSAPSQRKPQSNPPTRHRTE